MLNAIEGSVNERESDKEKRRENSLVTKPIIINEDVTWRVCIYFRHLDFMIDFFLRQRLSNGFRWLSEGFEFAVTLFYCITFDILLQMCLIT